MYMLQNLTHLLSNKKFKEFIQKKTTKNLLIYCTIIIKNNFNYENKLFIIFLHQKLLKKVYFFIHLSE